MNEDLRALVSEVYDVPKEKVDINLDVKHLPTWNSLNRFRFVTAIESKFNVSLTMEEILSMDSISSIVHVLRGKGVS